MPEVPVDSGSAEVTVEAGTVFGGSTVDGETVDDTGVEVDVFSSVTEVDVLTVSTV